MSGPRLYLSPPHLNGAERRLLEEALASGWITGMGPQLDAFEASFARLVGVKHAVGVSSGTAALHLALRALELEKDDEVYCSTLTFAASANPIVYEGGRPVFVDSDAATWNMDPNLLEEGLRRDARRGRPPRAVIAVDLYGQCADLDAIRGLCLRYGTTLIEDAAEALGATYKGRAAGSAGWANVFSFNGNKIVTASGGGMLATDDDGLAASARHLASQARDPAPHYEHSRIGYNYRLSNLLAAVGLAQLETLEERVAARRGNFERYRRALSQVEGLHFMPEAPYGRSTRWLTCVLIDPPRFGAGPEDARRRLEAEGIESRLVWKPMHLQPVYSGCRALGGSVAEGLFRGGLCLPSGSSLTAADVQRVAGGLLAAREGARVPALR